jgi:Domain of unknown function (DUF4166)
MMEPPSLARAASRDLTGTRGRGRILSGEAPRTRSRWLLAAAIYNLAWGLVVVADPALLLNLVGVRVVDPLAWRVIGMMVLVYAPAYAWAAWHRDRAKPIVFVGFFGKVCGVAGFLLALWAGVAPIGLGWIVLFNDAIWLTPFAAILLFTSPPRRSFAASTARADLWSPYLPVFTAGAERPVDAFTDQLLRRPEESFISVADGRMTRIWWRPVWLRPVFWMLGAIGILVPRQGMDVPARLRVRPAFDDLGRPYQVCDRQFDFSQPYAFVTIKKFEPDLGLITEAVGPRGFIVVAWDTTLRSERLLTFRTAAVGLQIGGQRAWLDKTIWRWIFGQTVFIQIADGVDSNRIDVRMTVRHPLLGPVFGYEGRFTIIKESKRAA